MEQEFEWIEPDTFIRYLFYFWQVNNSPHVCIQKHDREGSLTVANRPIIIGKSCLYDQDIWISDGAEQYLNRIIKMRGFW